MAGRHIRFSRRMLFTWFMMAASILFFAPKSWTNRFQFAFAHIFRWPLSIGRNISLSARATRQTNAPANDKQTQYKNYIAYLEEALKQADLKIEKISGLKDRLPFQGAKLMLADVYRVSMGPLRCELMINRGLENGIKKGQLVLANDTIIGALSQVAPRTAVVRLFTDPQSTIPVSLRGIETPRLLMQGEGSQTAKIKMVRQKAKIGTQVMACKMPEFLDAPMVVGTVAECRRNPEPLLWDITVRPACDIQALNDVVVIVMNPES